MQFWLWLLAISCFIIFYNYIGYALIVYILNKLGLRQADTGTHPEYTPSVTFVVAAYNEEECIVRKITNSLELDYPADKLQFLFVTDGSSDNTPGIISGYPRIQLLHSAQRSGKSAALNRAVSQASGDILIFCDANTLLNREAIRNIVRHYYHANVGGVAGEKKVLNTDAVGENEGLYWKYESSLKQLDSDFYSVVGAAGELFSLRRSLFEPVADNVILDDFILSLKVAQKGFRVIYEPEAYASELPSESLGDEAKRKVRIAAGGFQSMLMLTSLLNFFKHPRLTFLYVSHRALRWAVTPFCLVIVLLSTIITFFRYPGVSFFAILLVLQILFYGAALLYSVFTSSHAVMKIPRVIYYFVFMNISVIRGFFRFIRGNQSAVWEKARRRTA